MQHDPSIREYNKKKQKRQHYWWLYHIKKALGQRQNGCCADCHQEKRIRLCRINKGDDLPAVNDYLLLCSNCIAKRRADKEKQRQEEQSRRREEQKKTTEWIRKHKNRDKPSKEAIWARIRPLIFQRDDYKCVFCDTKEGLGLTSLIAESKGGSIQFDNYVACCQFCRGSKGNQLPLDFIWKREGYKYFLSESLDHTVTATPGATARLSLHFMGEIAEFCGKVTADDRVPPEYRKKAEFIHIRLSETDEDRRNQRKAEAGSWIG